MTDNALFWQHFGKCTDLLGEKIPIRFKHTETFDILTITALVFMDDDPQMELKKTSTMHYSLHIYGTDTNNLLRCFDIEIINPRFASKHPPNAIFLKYYENDTTHRAAEYDITSSKNSHFHAQILASQQPNFSVTVLSFRGCDTWIDIEDIFAIRTMRRESMLYYCMWAQRKKHYLMERQLFKLIWRYL